MATDIKLDQVDGSFVIIEGRVIKATASDVMIDAPDRRRGGGAHRRALVHDQNDGLTINFAGDYPGGVTLNHVSHIIPQPNIHQPLLPILAVHGGISYEIPARVGIGVGVEAARVTVVLQDVLDELQAQITALNAKVAALQARLHM